MPLLGRDLRVEAKARAKEFGTLYGWLESRDALVVKADRKPPLVVLLLEVMRAAEDNRAAVLSAAVSVAGRSA